MTKITDYLDELFPNPKCELEYNKDYELLIAVMLSAQTTDKRVNMVTKKLFSKYDSLEKLSNANIEDIITIIKPIGTFNKKAQNILGWHPSRTLEQSVKTGYEWEKKLSGILKQ